MLAQYSSNDKFRYESPQTTFFKEPALNYNSVDRTNTSYKKIECHLKDRKARKDPPLPLSDNLMGRSSHSIYQPNPSNYQSNPNPNPNHNPKKSGCYFTKGSLPENNGYIDKMNRIPITHKYNTSNRLIADSPLSDPSENSFTNEHIDARLYQSQPYPKLVSVEYGKSTGGMKRLYDRTAISDHSKSKGEFGSNRQTDLSGITRKY
jgi:hypothetical protein